MNTRRFYSLITPTIFAIVTSAFLVACQSNQVENSSIIIEVYEVAAGADNDYARGKLKYMEQENYVDGRMTNKVFYNADQTVRGKEVYSYDGDSKHPSGSKYYGQSGAILSTYKFVYQDSLKVKAEAFEGEDGELLRMEGFLYDDNGNMISKTIYNSLNQKQKSFIFGHDQYGNEVEMTLLDANDNRVLTESYEIATILDDGEWVEKWGYLNDESTPVTFYSKKKSE